MGFVVGSLVPFVVCDCMLGLRLLLDGCSLRVVDYFGFICCLLFAVVICLLFAVWRLLYMLCVAARLLFVCCLLLAVCWLLCTAGCRVLLLFAIYWSLLFGVCCCLVGFCCLLFVV